MIDGRAVVAAEQLARCRCVETGDLEPLEPRQLRCGIGSRRQDRGHRVGVEPTHREQDRVERCTVEPLDVVADEQQRPLLGRGREERQHRDPDEEPVACRRLRAKPERALERTPGRLRKLAEVPDERPAHLDERGEFEIRLGLESHRTQDPHPLGGLCRIVQQRGLACTRLAQEHQRARARTPPCLEERVDAGALLPTTDQHADQRIRGREATQFHG